MPGVFAPGSREWESEHVHPSIRRKIAKGGGSWSCAGGALLLRVVVAIFLPALDDQIVCIKASTTAP